MTKALVVLGVLAAAGITWFGYFWLEEQRRWGRPIRVHRDAVLNRYRGVL